MPKQPAFPSLRDSMKKKQTRRQRFLAEMDAVVPWGRLLARIEPHYPKTGPKDGRPPLPLETMLRVYFLQNWYCLSDPMADFAEMAGRLIDHAHRLGRPAVTTIGRISV